MRRAGAEFLAGREGFLGREVYRTGPGEYSGVIRWESEEARAMASRAWAGHPLAAGLDSLAAPTGHAAGELVHRDGPA